MLTVYFENRSVVFTSAGEVPAGAASSEHISGDDFTMLRFLPEVFSHEKQPETIYVECSDIAESFRVFCSRLPVITAAGGLVRSAAGNYLMIYRRGVWDLPKGKREDYESVEECALREVGEETGIGDLKLGEPICITRHTYLLDGRLVLKNTHWFRMEHPGEDLPVPQREEDISEARWLSPAQARDAASDAYLSIRDVLNIAL